jgi:hypothetical protein
MTRRQFELSEADLHPHLRNRMEQRGVTLAEVELVLNAGQEAASAKPGTIGRIMAIPYEAEWEGRFYEQKEVTVYYKSLDNETLILLTVLARYGQGF